jgi:hypothetical protein
MSALDAIAGDLALALDPRQVFETMVMTPDTWQSRLLLSDHKRLLLNIHRQAGKSSTVGVLAAHTAVYQPGALVLILSPALRQSQELFRKCLQAYHALGRPVPPDSETRLTLELENGSRIISLPGHESTIRGYSGVKLLIVDEASRVPDELYYSIRPMLAVSGGRLVALSTPFGKRGWFHSEWIGSGLWERYEVKAYECPRITADFLAEERRAMGVWFDQEYMCQFIEPEGSLFRYEDITAMFDESVQPLFGPPMGLPEPEEVSISW